MNKQTKEKLDKLEIGDEIVVKATATTVANIISQYTQETGKKLGRRRIGKESYTIQRKSRLGDKSFQKRLKEIREKK